MNIADHNLFWSSLDISNGRAINNIQESSMIKMAGQFLFLISSTCWVIKFLYVRSCFMCLFTSDLPVVMCPSRRGKKSFTSLLLSSILCTVH